MDNATDSAQNGEAYVPPNGWGNTDDESTAEQNPSRVPKLKNTLPDVYTEVEFPGASIREYWDAEKSDHTPWPKTYRMIMSGPDGMKKLDRKLVLSGVVRISRLHQAVALTETRTKSMPEVPNVVYTVEIDLGDDAPEPIFGRVSEADLTRTGAGSSEWLRKLGLVRHINSMDYKTLRQTLFGKVNKALKTGELRIEDVYSETGMLHIVESEGSRTVFLTPGDAGAVDRDGWNPYFKTELPSSFGSNQRIAALGYRPAMSTSLKESFAELFAMYDVTTERRWIPAGLLGTTGLAPMYGIHPHAVVALAIIGKTKQMKTTLASLILANQSSTERGRYVQPTINARSAGQQTTSYGMEKVLSRLGGFSVVVDDIITARQVNGEKDRRVALGKIESLVNKLYGERALKGGGIDMLTREIKLAEDGKPKASIVLTMEDFPRSEDCASIFNRMVVMDHDSSEYVDKTMLNRLQTTKSGSLRYNAQCHYVQELLRDPELFDRAWQEAGKITDGWRFADFERERDNYRRILAGNIALLKVGESVGTKGPTVAKVAGWLHDAAERQSRWIVTNESEESPLDIFRMAHTSLLASRQGTYSAPQREGSKAPIIFPDHTSLGLLEWSHLGYDANPAKRGDDALMEDEDAYAVGTEVIRKLSHRRMGFFVAWEAGKGRRPKLGARRFEYSTAEFDQLHSEVEQWCKRRGKQFVSKAEWIRLMDAEGVCNVGPAPNGGKGRVIQINADWLSQVGDFA